MTQQELLQAVNIGVTTPDTTINVDIYTGVQANEGNIFSKINDPESGVKVCSMTRTVKYAGNYTIALPQPVELKAGEFFSVVVSVKNSTNTAGVIASNERHFSNNDMSYYKDSSNGWTNCGSTGQGVALRIKAFTTLEDRTVIGDKDLAYASVKLKGNPQVRYGDDLSQVEIIVEYDGQILTKGVDYEINAPILQLDPPKETTSDSTPVGSAYIEVVGKGNWGGTNRVNFTILVGMHNFEKLGITVLNGKAVFEVGGDAKYYNDVLLPEGWVWTWGTDSLKIGENTGNYIDYQGSDKEYYRRNMYDAIVNKTEQVVQKIDISNSIISFDLTQFVYSGNAIRPNFTTMLNGENLVGGVDFISEFVDNINVGIATLKVKGIGKYNGEKIATFQIIPANMLDVDMVVNGNYVWTGSEIIPKVNVVYNGIILSKGIDYHISFSNNINAGIANIVVDGKGNFSSSKTTTFTIAKAPNAITSFVIENGQPKASAIYGNIVYKYYLDSACKVEISKPTAVGTYYVKAYALESDNWLGAESEVLEYIIEEKKIDIAGAVITLDGDDFVYNGSPFTPEVGVSLDNITLVPNEHYTVTYSNNINAGTGIVVVMGNGIYVGSVTTTFTIAKAQSQIIDFEIVDGVPVANATLGNAVYKYYSDISCTNEISRPTTPGEYYVKAVVEGNDNFGGIESQPISFVISPTSASDGLDGGIITIVAVCTIVVVIAVVMVIVIVVKRRKI